MSKDFSNKEISSNLIWRFLERFGAQGITFIVSLVLARVLDPSVYGTVALVTVITSILQVFVDSGLGTALIQKKDTDDIDYSTVFYFNLFFSIVLYILLFILAPIIANLYKNTELVPVIRVIGIIVLIAGVKNILQAYVSKNLLFKKFFFATLGGTIGAGFLGIWMAYHGYGVWALVAQYIFNATVDTIILWITVGWRPTKAFSIARLKQLFAYGWKLLVSTLLDRIWAQMRQLIIGVKYSTEDLAYYNKGHEFPDYATTAINSSIDSVLLPVMSSAQENKKEVKNMTRRAIRVSSYIMWPIMIGLAACAKPLIGLLLTDKWLPAVPYLRIFCITYVFYPIHTANLNAIKAVGRSDIFLKLEVIKKVVGFIIVISSMWFGVYVLALSSIITSFASQIINSWPNKKLLGYSYGDQIKDLLPSIVMSLIMGVTCYCIQFLGFGYLITLLIQIPLGMLMYILMSKFSRYEPYLYCESLMRSFLHRKV